MFFENSHETAASRQLAATLSRAATLVERLDERWVPDEQRRVATICEDRLETWRRTVAGAAPALFDRRLAFLSQSREEDRLRVCVGPVRLAGGAEPPAWTAAIDGILAAAAGPVDPSAARFLEPGEPVPFEDVLAPVVQWASGRLSQEAGLQDGLFSGPSLGALERLLLRRLAHVSSVALMHQLALFRLQNGLLPAGTDGYQAFCRAVSADGMRTLLSRYPMLARLLPTVVEHWLGACAELAARVRADREALRAAFGCAAPLGQVRKIRAGLSDPHAGGRMVAALTFGNGLAVVYKPHDLGVVAAFSELLRWLGERGGGPGLLALRSLPREGYGWMELAEHRPCRDEEEVRLYYRRAGGLLGLAYLLDGTDFHFENLIAAGSHPVLVDLEMLFHPPLEAPGEGAQALARHGLDASVLRTGLLPGWRIGNAGKCYDVSGLTAVGGQETSHFGPRWEHVNTDAMTLRFEPLRTPAAQNLPRLGDRAVPAWEHAEDIEEGLRLTYRALLDLRAELAAGPLARFEGLEVRYVCRATQAYGGFLDELADPSALCDGVSFGLVLEKLWHDFLADEARQLLAPLVDFEARALARRDVPRFRMRTDSRSIWAGDELVIAEAFPEAGHPRMLRRLSELCEADLERQAGLLRASLFTRREGSGRGSGPQGEEAAAGDQTRMLGAGEAVEAALAVVRALEAGAIRAGETVTWISLGMNAGEDVYRFQPMGPSLYSGGCGVAVFLAAAAKLGGCEVSRSLALAALAELRTDLRASDAGRRLAHLDIGGGSGLGSIVYGLLCCGRLLDDPELLEEASRAAALVTEARLAADGSFDVMRGAAGAMLALTALHAARPDAALRRLVRACGEHLLQTRCDAGGGLQSWKTLDGKPRTGFAHGAAGIAYALLRAGQLCGEPAFERAAAEALAFEDTLFSEESGNWVVHPLENGEPPAPMATWCNGAPGIGLARLQGCGVLDARALAATRGSLGIGADFLCCGELGKLELLLVAAEALGQPALRDEALRHAAWVLDRAKRRGRYLLSRNLPEGVNDYSLFTGIAGIGYQLLRLTHTEDLPSVLSWL